MEFSVCSRPPDNATQDGTVSEALLGRTLWQVLRIPTPEESRRMQVRTIAPPYSCMFWRARY